MVTKAWLVDGRIMRNRKTFGSRHFSKTKAQAERKADQLRTLRRNEGASALSLSAADRIDAEAALSLLAPHHRSLRKAAEFFVKPETGLMKGHVEAPIRQVCYIAADQKACATSGFAMSLCAPEVPPPSQM